MCTYQPDFTGGGFKGGMSRSACTNLINSVSTTLHVPMRRRGTDRIHSMGGFCCCSQRSAWLYSHLCSTDGTYRHNTVPTMILDCAAGRG